MKTTSRTATTVPTGGVHRHGGTPTPAIRGIFVNSHIEAVRRAMGDEGVQTLEERYGAPIGFRATQSVPVREEVRIIELSLDLLSQQPVAPEARAFEAGRLHFRNFTTTPWAKILFTVFPRNFLYMMRHAHTIAERVFKGVSFSTEVLNDTSVRVVMENNDYPIDHFRGLFQEWLEYFGHTGTVEADETAPSRYEYLIQWD